MQDLDLFPNGYKLSVKIPNKKLLYELDTKTNHEETLTYHVSNLFLMKQTFDKGGVLDRWLDELLSRLIEDYIWLYDRDVILKSHPPAYLPIEERKRFKDYIERKELLEAVIKEHMYLFVVEIEE